MQRVFLVGGSFFNASEPAILFLYEELIRALANKNVLFTPVVFTGRTLKSYAASLKRELEKLPAGDKVTIVSYSMGAQVVRLLAEQEPELFERTVRKAVEVEPVPATGFSWKAFWSAFKRVPGAFLISFLGLGIKLNVDEVQRFFSEESSRIPPETARKIANAAHAQPLWPALRTAFPPLVRTCPELELTVPKVRVVRASSKSFITEGMAMAPTIVLELEGHGAPFDPASSDRVAAIVA